ncbi:WD repeat-containing protein 44 [Morus notabilis]|uniref:WD repeat-containing protein 44 n=1 Tax=Morus notabilis TaxID=981085 RepID=W9R8H3_9ROSA|nr:WD repeat-containing protein 44 [Morus notabilis]EXB41001.1 WD repeat-containing protein 44 [Morus notabilis]
MLIGSNDTENDIFFDSLDRFEEELSSSCRCKLGYEIWVNEPTASVEQRRHNFLRQMGLAEFASPNMKKIPPTSEEQMGLHFDRLKDESNGAVSLHYHMSSPSEALECFTTREEAAKANLVSDGLKNDQHKAVLARETVASSHDREERRRNFRHGMKNMSTSWWKHFVNKRKERSSRSVVSEEPKPAAKTPKIKVLQKKKRCLELTAPYLGQEIGAHKGPIWTMKFSPDGQYLASGGEDGVVRVWRVRAVDANSSLCLPAEENYLCGKPNGRKLMSFKRKHPIHASVIFPDKIFRIEESPVQEFRGHYSDVLDLAWSNSNCILSSSKDKTVRLWQLGCNDCLNVFHHNNYVTCIHFNPVDDNYFISGSIDGKVRIWGLSEKRVVDWTEVRDVITAICYQPDGRGFIVGSITGTCRSYKVSGEGLVLEARIHIPGRKKSAGNKITGIKFSRGKSQRVMISSEDSKLRMFDGVDLTYKYKGLGKSGSQMSASFTSCERHIISLGEDSRVYIWNHDASSFPPSKQTKSVRWSGMETEGGSLSNASSMRAQEHLEAASWTRESERFSLGGCFSMGSATWPEEKLPLWELSTAQGQNHNTTSISETWGLVIVAAGFDGTIRTFHNYGLPIRL